jgi:hypothetical protein
VIGAIEASLRGHLGPAARHGIGPMIGAFALGHLRAGVYAWRVRCG